MQRQQIQRWCAIAILGVSTTAIADEIPTIKLTDTGPDQDIPTQHSFYVTGDVDDSTRAVRAVIARKGSAAMFGSDGPSCGRLADQLHIERSGSRSLDAGVHRASELFPVAAPGVASGQIMISALWTRPSSGDASTYKVLVPTDETFFAPGYSFCLYVLRNTQKVDRATIADAIDDVAAAFDRCADTDVVKNATDTEAAAAALAACKTSAQSQFDAAIDKLLDHALLVVSPGHLRTPSCLAGKPTDRKPTDRDNAYCALTSAVTAALGPAETIHEKRAALDQALAATTAPGLSHDWLATSGPGSDLGQAIVAMLTNHGSLFSGRRGETSGAGKSNPAVAPPPATINHLTNDGQIAVTQVSILDDDLRIRVATSAAPTAAKTLDGVTTADLVVTAGITLHDLLALGHGVIPGHGTTPADKDTTFAELRTAIRKVGLTPSWTTAERAYFESVRDRLGRVANLMGATSTAFAEETPAAFVGHVRAWLAHERAMYLAQIAASLVMLVEPPAEQVNLVQIATDLKTLVAQKEAFDDAASKLVFIASEQVQLGGPQPVPFHIGFDQKAWVFSYVTPTIGYAQIDSHDGWFSTPYFAAQIHLYPNPVNDPMWRHGITASDLRRAFALELGFANTLSSFGPDDRYRGVFGLPPPFIALALHPLPYTSISMGGALLERRTTVLPVESPHWAPSFFVGLNVQINIPDLIRSEKTSSPTVGPATTSNTNP